MLELWASRQLMLSHNTASRVFCLRFSWTVNFTISAALRFSLFKSLSLWLSPSPPDAIPTITHIAPFEYVSKRRYFLLPPAAIVVHRLLRPSLLSFGKAYTSAASQKFLFHVGYRPRLVIIYCISIIISLRSLPAHAGGADNSRYSSSWVRRQLPHIKRDIWWEIVFIAPGFSRNSSIMLILVRLFVFLSFMISIFALCILIA